MAIANLAVELPNRLLNGIVKNVQRSNLIKVQVLGNASKLTKQI